MSTVTNNVLSVRIPNNLIKSLDKLATLMDRSKSYIAEQAIAEYVDENAWLIQQSQAGLRDSKAERIVGRKEADVFFQRLQKKILKSNKI